MVRGLDLFREHFAAYGDRYVLIGGTACALALEDVELTFRATKDLDIVLFVEAMDVDFARALWDFINRGQYEHRQKSTGRELFYRFDDPGDEAYPAMLELFSRLPEALDFVGEGHLTPIPVAGDVASLSAILLADDYYSLVQDGRTVTGGLPVVGPAYLIPLKIRAWLDLTDRANAGETVDSRTIAKHRRDVFRLYQVLAPDVAIGLPATVVPDVARFIAACEAEQAPDPRSFGVDEDLSATLAVFREVYGCAG